MRARTIVLILSFLVFVLAAAASRAATAETNCIRCHGSDLFPPEARARVRTFAEDVHAQVGLSCHDCHGGNPDPAIEDMSTAMDRRFVTRPFVGRPQRTDIPSFCGRCHSSAEYMKRFNPAARVDQVAEYWSSRHGQKLREGDTRVATCVDCHSVHGIQRRDQPASPVHATKVAETCSRCHSNRKLMGEGIPIDQFAKWRVSVHAKAMFDKGDLTAPTCNDCHGNHGAAPPGVESVSFVCGQCHTREAELFRASTKHQQWEEHTTMMAGAACGTCHDDGRGALAMTRFSECVTCHDNHGVVRPTVAMLGALPDTPCAFCHEGTGPAAQRVAEPRKKAENYRQLRADLLKQAASLGLRGDARFDWLVDLARNLPNHKDGEFQRLFDKFRIGKTHYTYRDLNGFDVPVRLRRCNDCHDDAVSAPYVDATRSLTSMIARSERILVTAHRGGVEVRKVRPALDSAVDAQIELEALVHTFAAPQVQAKRAEGLEHAEAALVAGQQALDELSFRRRGLWFALVIVLMVLGGLAAKIRTL